MKSKEDIKREDEEFHKVLELWVFNDDKEAYSRLWTLVTEATTSVIKKRVTGLKVADFEEKVLDSVLDVMKKVQKLKNAKSVDVPRKLATFVFPYTSWPLYKPSTVFYEKAISLDSYLENKGDVLTDEYVTNIEEEY